MNIEGVDRSHNVPGMGPAARRPRSPEEAAKQFEQILVQQMVRTMTKDLFDGSLTGDDAPQWMGAYNDIQSDVLTTELAQKITHDGRLGIADLLMKQWSRGGETPSSPGELIDSTENPS